MSSSFESVNIVSNKTIIFENSYPEILTYNKFEICNLERLSVIYVLFHVVLFYIALFHRIRFLLTNSCSLSTLPLLDCARTNGLYFMFLFFLPFFTTRWRSIGSLPLNNEKKYRHLVQNHQQQSVSLQALLNEIS